jgi:hypothetical protein
MKINKKIAIVLSVTGIVAFLLQIFSGFLAVLFNLVFGYMWMSQVRHRLIDVGLSEYFVTHYVSFALLNVPIWVVLAIITFCLGFSARKWATYAAMALSVWIPIMDFVYSSLYYRFFSQPGVMWHMMLQFNIHIVSLCGIIFGILGWSLGHGLRTLIGKRDNARHE